MKKPQIQRIIPHLVSDDRPKPLLYRLDYLYIQIIENRLSHLNLTPGQKRQVIDRIIENLRASTAHRAPENL